MSNPTGFTPGQQSRYSSSMARTLNQELGVSAGRAGARQSLAPPNQTRRNAGNKDLIIRMLAEIFQVRQDDDGQLRWQQVSSSLVPVSLYSRTTSNWLDYLVATSPATQATDPTSTMSPDSRNFLLLLQQFHQAKMSTQSNLKQQLQQGQDQCIVFQVVGHDFIDGQCKRVLNVKIQQPGTRLGQASDYFVYWREQSSQRKFLNPQIQYQFSSSITSNNSFMPRTTDGRCTVDHNSPIFNQALPFQESHTWGLNFASVNDAKLFFDICSLNLVDLDFNSEYLKQVPLTERQQRLVGQNIGISNLNLLPVSAMIHQKRPVLQELHRKQQFENCRARTINKYSNHSFRAQAVKRQPSTVKCSSCQQIVKSPRYDSRQTNQELAQEVCPVHGYQQTMRHRSRSTTRNISNHKGDIKKARSYSTPASPENICPVHQQRNKQDVVVYEANSQHDLKCSDRTHRQQCSNHRDVLDQQSVRSGKPPKPVRGLMRTTTIEQNDDQSPSTFTKLKATNVKSTSKSKLNSGDFELSNEFQQLRNEQAFLQKGRKYELSNEDNLLSQPRKKLTDANRSYNDTADTFDSLSKMDARLARARYANSKNMKEFLSLDAGGTQNKLVFNDRLQRKQTRLGANNFATKQSETKVLGGASKKHKHLAPSADTLTDCGSTGKRCVENTSTRQHSCHQSGGDGPSSRLATNLDTLVPATSVKSSAKLDSGDHENNSTCNVSTTTEDLPLDPKMRRRMLKLTSEEAISERTEPKSSLTSTTLEKNFRENEATPSEGQRDSQMLQQDKIDRQVRAVSLGPPPGFTRAEGFKPKSDTGRRRSLERSTCVDLEPTLPASLCRKTSRLSPFPQSALCSTVPEIENGSVSAGSCAMEGGIEMACRRNIRPQSDFFNICTGSSFTPNLTQEGGTKLDSSENREELNFDYTRQKSDLTNDRTRRNLNRNANQRMRHNQQKPMTTFKSAPDISGLNRKRALRTGATNLASDTINDVYFKGAEIDSSAVSRNFYHDRITTIDANSRNNTQTTPRMTSTLSTYAVPLYSDKPNGDPSFSRHYHSCPSSLRRRRGHSRQYTDETDDYGFGIPVENFRSSCHCRGCLCTSTPRGFVQPYLNFHPTTVTAHNEAVEFQCTSCHRMINRALAPDKEGYELTRCFDCNSTYNSLCRFQLSQRHHFDSHCEHNDDLLQKVSYWQPQIDVSKQHQPGVHQSKRSPLRYGLYESDYEEEQAVGQRTGHCDPHNDQTAIKSAYLLEHKIIKPFQGYDQTMARASLKSRQRSKSQPPKECLDEQAIHISKSMENVKKLIREVQYELDTLKRLPMSTASIDLRDSETNQVVVGRSEKIGSSQIDQQTKASLEERINFGNQQTNIDSAGERHSQTTRQVNSTSATRRAGQFKCAGAIRKAGFLSVKKWILKRHQSIELARKQGWKRYWVCLRGTALLFHSVIDRKNSSDAKAGGGAQQDQIDLLSWIKINCNNQSLLLTNLLQSESQQDSLDHDAFLKNIAQCYIEREPRHLIIIDGAIAQPIPEHPKRDFVFCLSTTFGDAYLFQASCQLESDNWIAAIHNACAASIARELTRDEAIKLFESKIRHLEMEADKKLFLKQRLDSRLTSMLTMTRMTSDTDDELARGPDGAKNQLSKSTLRSLLHRLSQQLQTLENFIERLYCEIYQLSCYSSSCDAQRAFYSNNADLHQQGGSKINLPHPKTLLMHVSKPTKLLLIKLGIFTVSSFHAYIHARQDSAETIVNRMQQQANQQQQPSCPMSPLELRIRSQSVGENPLIKDEDTAKLETDTEELIQITNLKSITIHVNKDLYYQLRESVGNLDTRIDGSDGNDDYSVQDGGDFVMINLRLNPSSTSASIVKQVLKITEPNLDEFEFLYYNLRLSDSTAKDEQDSTTTASRVVSKQQQYYIAKRRDTLNDWALFDCIELFQKSIYKLKLTRSRLDEDTAAPFGISLEGQLLTGSLDSVLNVYCSYVEWGSVSDKAGLRDEDELLSINGIQTCDLDMMFVECMIQDATELKLIIRSNLPHPVNSVSVEKSTWTPTRPDGNSDEDDDSIKNRNRRDYPRPTENLNFVMGESSKIISDEHITSLVCPPPPAQSDAFLRTDTSLIRRKSDLGSVNGQFQTEGCLLKVGEDQAAMSKSVSQHALVDTTIDPSAQVDNRSASVESGEKNIQYATADLLVKQLLRKTERLTRLIGRDIADTINSDSKTETMNLCTGGARNGDLSSTKHSAAVNNNALVERFKKSILELVETEFAYLKHLETINEHYMIPLEKADYLNFYDLKQLNDSIASLLKFHRNFFNSLITKLSNKFKLESLNAEDEYERLNVIVRHLETCRTSDALILMFQAVAELFLAEAENFKLYTSYCIAYSRLQRLLHPKHSSKSSSSITLIPSALNTFSSSLIVPGSIVVSSNIGSASQTRRANQKDTQRSMELMFSVSSNGHASNQLKELSDFLNNLDSSSSSISLSCSSKSSISDQQQSTNQLDHEKQIKQSAKHASTNSSSSLNQSSSSLRKSVHQQNFESYLIKPIQRIVKYPMLLSSVATTISQLYPDKSFHEDITHSIRQMELVIGHVNETQRVHDEYGVLFDNIERQYFNQQANDLTKSSITLVYGPHQPVISLNMDQMLYFGEVDWLNINEFATKSKLSGGSQMSQAVFVFKSCVIFISKERIANKTARKKAQNSSMQSSSVNKSSNLNGASKVSFHANNGDYNEVVRYQTLIPVSEVQVRSTPADSKAKQLGKSNTDRYHWEMFQCSSSNSNSSLLTKSSSKKQSNNGKAYLFACQTNDERSRFLRKIRLIIRESVRNMSLPLTRSPSIKSSHNTTANKKLSTSSTDTNTNTNSSCSQATSLSPDSHSRNAEQERSSAIMVSSKKVDCRFGDQLGKSAKLGNGIEVNN